MNEQKSIIRVFVNEQKAQDKTITKTLKELGIKRSTYYAWQKPQGKKKPDSPRMAMLTPEEKNAIETVKEAYPHLRHRQLQGILQMKGLYRSYSSVYQHLKSLNMIEPYERRPDGYITGGHITPPIRPIKQNLKSLLPISPGGQQSLPIRAMQTRRTGPS